VEKFYGRNHLLTNRLGKPWQIYQTKGVDTAFSLKELRISPLTAQILFNRGISNTDQARSFLYPALSDLPDPFTMRDMEKAVGRIFQAIRNRERITLFGDYDVDGVTAIALLFLFLQGAGALVDFYLPRRLEEGYGLNMGAIKKIHSQGTKLMITADLGISNFEEIRWAEENGLDVIVTDHHEIPETLPPALAILNPKQKNCSYPFKALAGVGVAFNLTIALRSTLRQEGFWKGSSVPNLREYLDLVALGTISDVVPLTGVNRILAKYGLMQLASSSRAGILALKEVSGMGHGIPVDTTGVNFRLAPRINAAGRLGDAREAVGLLISRDGAEAKEIATHLNDLNSLRQRIEDKILAEAKEMIESGAIDQRKKSFVLASVSWHPGIIGIVASRLIEEYHRPIILIAIEENLGKGSARSVDPFSLYRGLKACCAWVEKFGGHEQAAGLIIRQECIAGFSQAFEEVVAKTLAGEDFIPPLFVDALSRLDQMGGPFLLELEALSPFGAGNPEPVLAMEDLAILDSKLVGKGHLRLRIREGGLTREAIGFHMASWHPLSGGRMKMAFSPQVGFFRGRRTLQLKIVDLKPMD